MGTMHQLILQFISLKAQAESVSEYEIYTRYLDREKKLERLLSPPLDEEVREMPAEYL